MYIEISPALILHFSEDETMGKNQQEKSKLQIVVLMK